MKVFSLMFPITALILVCVGMSFLFPPVLIEDAYCDLYSNFTFTLENKGGSDRYLKYEWKLNDPMAELPLYEEEGLAVLIPYESKQFTFETINPLHKYDLRGCVIYITVYEDGRIINNYREQKSPSDWDYSFLPPVRKFLKF
jgi:hypothetical protein